MPETISEATSMRASLPDSPVCAANTQNRLRVRAKLLSDIRNYFCQRDCLEVDTPLLRRYSVTDPYMRAFRVSNPEGQTAGYLQTSPEYAMKRLLCAGSGDIFQLGKVFRADESGPHHCNEFTLLEWYRLGFDLWQLVEESLNLIQLLVGGMQVKYYAYDEAINTFLGEDISAMSLAQLADFSEHKLGQLPINMLRDNYLTLLFSALVEPKFEPYNLTVIHSFPPSQAALAKIAIADIKQPKMSAHAAKILAGKEVAMRFEIYAGGLELANGFCELTDSKEQRRRFQEDNRIRTQLNYPQIELDELFLEDIRKGLPVCSGVALGVDRLLMLQQKFDHIEQVLALAES